MSVGLAFKIIAAVLFLLLTVGTSSLLGISILGAGLLCFTIGSIVP